MQRPAGPPRRRYFQGSKIELGERRQRRLPPPPGECLSTELQGEPVTWAPSRGPQLANLGLKERRAEQSVLHENDDGDYDPATTTSVIFTTLYELRTCPNILRVYRRPRPLVRPPPSEWMPGPYTPVVDKSEGVFRVYRAVLVCVCGEQRLTE